MTERWRLINGTELYDMNMDPAKKMMLRDNILLLLPIYATHMRNGGTMSQNDLTNIAK